MFNSIKQLNVHCLVIMKVILTVFRRSIGKTISYCMDISTYSLATEQLLALPSRLVLESCNTGHIQEAVSTKIWESVRKAFTEATEVMGGLNEP